jgi:hypothetical protein
VTWVPPAVVPLVGVIEVMVWARTAVIPSAKANARMIDRPKFPPQNLERNASGALRPKMRWGRKIKSAEVGCK